MRSRDACSRRETHARPVWIVGWNVLLFGELEDALLEDELRFGSAHADEWNRSITELRGHGVHSGWRREEAQTHDTLLFCLGGERWTSKGLITWACVCLSGEERRWRSSRVSSSSIRLSSSRCVACSAGWLAVHTHILPFTASSVWSPGLHKVFPSSHSIHISVNAAQSRTLSPLLVQPPAIQADTSTSAI